MRGRSVRRSFEVIKFRHQCSATAADWRAVTSLPTDGPIRLKKGVGYRPIQKMKISSGTSVTISRQFKILEDPVLFL